jgi:type I restriction enzyme R subunit
MPHQSEQILEDKLLAQLKELGYKYITIKDEADLLLNLKSQLEKHNKITLNDNEFKRVINHLNKGNVFEKAKTLRDKMQLTKDDGESIYIEFIQQEHWCQNQFQVTNQVNMEGTYKNRYDVTILVNGLPLVQIELKRRGLGLKEAFNQTNRYQKHSYGAGAGLFQYIQLFVISNGENTKYFANNKRESFKQTFYWSDKNNQTIRQLSEFTREFLEPCHMSKMVTKYVVLNEAFKVLMVLRPYQYFAVEAIIDRVKNTRKNGYIWHTTGSGKTLTSFKASQILKNIPKVDRVMFVVDRKDLDYQTQKEFDAFSKGSVDATDNTNMLVRQFEDNTQLIVTTIQKLNNAINSRYKGRMEAHKNERIIFIFDECHRSQFGETHSRIKSFFTNAQMFGFTGTPIFADNAVKNALGKRTTKELFDECLHKYVITDAIRDENVLKFSIEYVGKYHQKDDAKTELDIEVEDIDTKELLESDERLDKIADYIIANHNRKTHGKDFTAMFCVSSVDMLIRYYELFKQKHVEGKHNLNIATIFSYTANEDDKDANGMIEEEELSIAAEPKVMYLTKEHKHTRDKLEEFIGDYNQAYNTKFTTKDSQSFYNYYNDIARKVKSREIDILLVVNMFLTGFDSKTLSTLYVDKNLKYHGLIQAFSRTNRILNEQKSQGNIVCFRNLKKATDDAIALFSNKQAKEEIIIAPYEDYVGKFNEAFDNLQKLTPKPDDVNQLADEEEELKYIQAFRELMRLKNVLTTFTDFEWADLEMDEQNFENFKGKYLDLYEKVKTDRQKEKVSVLNDVDFELDLIHRDEVNVAYILKLLAKLKEAKAEEKEQHKKQIIEAIAGEAKLRSKRELIEKFIEENLPEIKDIDEIPEAFEKFWNTEEKKAIDAICEQELLDPDKFRNVLEDYIFTQREPLRDEVLETLQGKKPGIRERKTVAKTIIGRIADFVETFMSGMEG